MTTFRFLVLLACAIVCGSGLSSTDLPGAASPFLLLARTVAGSFLWTAAIVPIAIVVAACWKKRFFCRCLCPMGATFLLLRKGHDLIFKRKSTPPIRHGAFVGIALLIPAVVGAFLHLAPMAWPIMLDPLVLFCAMLHATFPLFFVAIALCVLSLVAPWFWCGNCCPLGAMQSLLFRIAHPFRKKKQAVANSSDKVDTYKPRTGRRSFLLAASALALAVVAFPILSVRSLARRWFRPPGALDEARFNSLCTGCGRCIVACPTKHLIPSIGCFPRDADRSKEPDRSKAPDRTDESQRESRARFPLDPRPTVETQKTWCDDDCVACGRVCPTGAIRRFTVDDKKNLRVGVAIYDFDHCLLYMDKECTICVQECHWNAIALKWSDDNSCTIPVIDTEKCTGCGRCVVVCPGFDPIYHGEDEPDYNPANQPPPPKAMTIVMPEEKA